MAPSQLKQLKASLRQQGLVGPQKSKKQKRQSSENRGDAQRKLQKAATLHDIRERFNPFEVKAPARRAKFDTVSLQKNSNGVQGRPGVTKGLGEERVTLPL